MRVVYVVSRDLITLYISGGFVHLHPSGSVSVFAKTTAPCQPYAVAYALTSSDVLRFLSGIEVAREELVEEPSVDFYLAEERLLEAARQALTKEYLCE